MMSNYLTHFHSYLPSTLIVQSEGNAWIKNLHQLRDPENRERISKFVDRFCIGSDKISSRRTLHSDFSHDDTERFKLFGKENNYRPRLEQRSASAQSLIEEVAQAIYYYQDSAPAHLLHVSCTHYQSPSAAQKIVSASGWGTIVTHLYHMGCYAALPAIRTASALSGDGKVDIFHSEVCSLHFKSGSYTPEQLVIQSLFSDGLIKYSCVKSERALPHSLKIHSLHEVLVPDTDNDMTWSLGAYHFEMTLSKNVPRILSEKLERFLEQMFAKAERDFQKERENTLFAIHPGGPKIIDQCQEILALRDDQVADSNEILKNRGNMSSATLPHIWERVVNSDYQGLVATVAFGPGLTMTGALLEKC